jgi:hypothetical protein
MRYFCEDVVYHLRMSPRFAGFGNRNSRRARGSRSPKTIHPALRSTTCYPSRLSSLSCAGATAPGGSTAWKPDGSLSHRDSAIRRSAAFQ